MVGGVDNPATAEDAVAAPLITPEVVAAVVVSRRCTDFKRSQFYRTGPGHSREDGKGDTSAKDTHLHKQAECGAPSSRDSNDTGALREFGCGADELADSIKVVLANKSVIKACITR